MIRLTVTDAETVERFYQRFKWGVLSPIKADRWTLYAGDVRRWLELAAGTDERRAHGGERNVSSPPHRPFSSRRERGAVHRLLAGRD